MITELGLKLDVSDLWQVSGWCMSVTCSGRLVVDVCQWLVAG